MDDLFVALEQSVTSQGDSAMLTALAERLIAEGRFHEWFDLRLVELRRRLGLPAVSSRTMDELPEPLRTQMEEGYLEACREVGGRLLEAGRVREAWIYLRVPGESARMVEWLEQHVPRDDQLEGAVEVAVQQGLCPARGLDWVLGRWGTCHAISLVEGCWASWLPSARQQAAGVLVRHLHSELLATLRREVIARDPLAATATLPDLVGRHPELFAEDNYHLDTSHLNAVVRLARVVVDPEIVEQALELTVYGQALSSRYRYPGEAPFEDPFTAQGLFFSAQRGERVDEALAYFTARAQQAAEAAEDRLPGEVLVTLLARLGRWSEALTACQGLPAGGASYGLAPSLWELAERSGDFAGAREVCRRRGDVVGYAAALVEGHRREA